MSYTLLAGFTTGRIDTDQGTFRIAENRVTVDDYDTARALVDDYGLSWLGEAPDAPADDADGDSSPDNGDDGDEAESDDDTCGYYDPESMADPCGRTAGWGRDADTGRCEPHHDIEADGESEA